MDKLTGVLESTGYIECSVEDQEVSFDVDGVPREKFDKGISWLNVTLDSTQDMTITINSLHFNSDNSDLPLLYHISVVTLSTGEYDKNITLVISI